MSESLRNKSIREVGSILSMDPEIKEFYDVLFDMKGKIFEKLKKAEIVDEEADGSDHDYFVNRVLYWILSEWFHLSTGSVKK